MFFSENFHNQFWRGRRGRWTKVCSEFDQPAIMSLYVKHRRPASILSDMIVKQGSNLLLRRILNQSISSLIPLKWRIPKSRINNLNSSLEGLYLYIFRNNIKKCWKGDPERIKALIMKNIAGIANAVQSRPTSDCQ